VPSRGQIITNDKHRVHPRPEGRRPHLLDGFPPTRQTLSVQSLREVDVAMSYGVDPPAKTPPQLAASGS
jgi:hypothetical protein